VRKLKEQPTGDNLVSRSHTDCRCDRQTDRQRGRWLYRWPYKTAV